MGDPSQTADMDSAELVSTGGLDAIVVAIGCKLDLFCVIHFTTAHCEV